MHKSSLLLSKLDNASFQLSFGILKLENILLKLIIFFPLLVELLDDCFLFLHVLDHGFFHTFVVLGVALKVPILLFQFSQLLNFSLQSAHQLIELLAEVAIFALELRDLDFQAHVRLELCFQLFNFCIELAGLFNIVLDADIQPPNLFTRFFLADSGFFQLSLGFFGFLDILLEQQDGSLMFFNRPYEYHYLLL